MYDDDYDPEEELDERLAEEPVKPPENMKLTIEVGLSEYSPNGLLELLARGLLQQVGGRDRWSGLLEEMLLKMGEEKARGLVDEAIVNAWSDTSPEVNFGSIVRKAAADYMNEHVNGNGQTITDRYRLEGARTRMEWLVAKLTKEAMDGAFKQAAAEWKASAQQAIKETLTDTLANRLAKALPPPPEVRG